MEPPTTNRQLLEFYSSFLHALWGSVFVRGPSPQHCSTLYRGIVGQVHWFSRAVPGQRISGDKPWQNLNPKIEPSNQKHISKWSSSRVGLISHWSYATTIQYNTSCNSTHPDFNYTVPDEGWQVQTTTLMKYNISLYAPSLQNVSRSSHSVQNLRKHFWHARVTGWSMCFGQ